MMDVKNGQQASFEVKSMDAIIQFRSHVIDPSEFSPECSNSDDLGGKERVRIQLVISDLVISLHSVDRQRGETDR
jgi:hypothetical protein